MSVDRGRELVEQPRGLAAARGCAGAAAARPARGPRAAASTSARSRAGSSTLPARCAVASDVLAGLDARLAQRREVLARPRLDEVRDVDHDVADEAHGAGDALARAGSPPPCRSGASSRSLEVVGEDAVELLRHPAVERAHPRLDVRDRDAAPAPRPGRRRASSSCRRRRAPRPARSSASSGPSAASIRAVCSVFVPPCRGRARAPGAGSRAPRRRPSTARRRSAGRCGRGPRRARRAARG